MDEPYKHTVKGKPDSEVHLMHGSIYTKFKSMQNESVV